MRERRADTAFLKKGGNKGWERSGGVRCGGGGAGRRGRGCEREGERGRERVQPRSTHLVRVEEERSEENSSLRDLSPISVGTADKGDDIYTAVALTPTINKQE